MQIGKDTVVLMDYTLKDKDGATIDTSEGKDPLAFIFGIGAIIPGLEKELDGKKAGDNVQVTVAPEDGYGVYDEQLIVDVPKDRFEGAGEIAAGMQVQAQREDGGVQIMTVSSVADESVKLDGNHPLAGMTLFFDVDVREVREATKEELEHGHVH